VAWYSSAYRSQSGPFALASGAVTLNPAKLRQVGTPPEVYDRPAPPFVYQFLGNVTVLKATALAAGTTPPLPAGGLQSNGQIFVRPHDIEVVPHETGGPGIPAVLRYIHAAGPQARLTLEQVENRETVEAEVSRPELVRLDPTVHSPGPLPPRRSGLCP